MGSNPGANSYRYAWRKYSVFESIDVEPQIFSRIGDGGGSGAWVELENS
jgi:hypothetical protein